jgi:hypothetical protein
MRILRFKRASLSRIAKAVTLGCLLVFSLFCWRFTPFKEAGLYAFTYLIGHYEERLSAHRPQRDLWFTSHCRFETLVRCYKIVFGIRFGDEVRYRPAALPSTVDIQGKEFEVTDLKFEIRGYYHLRLVEGRWADLKHSRPIVIITVGDSVF